MAHPHLAVTLARFPARVHRTKNRLVSIPAEVQRRLGLERRPENHIALVSLRKEGRGRWNHHLVKLTEDNEFAIPADVAGIAAGDEVEVKVHRLIEDREVPVRAAGTGAGLLVALAAEPRAGWRETGSTDLDEVLDEQARGA
jgi:hypothetical protein